MLAQQALVVLIVVITEKGLSPPVATLGDMVRKTGEDSAGKASHEATIGPSWLSCQLNALSP